MTSLLPAKVVWFMIQKQNLSSTLLLKISFSKGAHVEVGGILHTQCDRGHQLKSSSNLHCAQMEPVQNCKTNTTTQLFAWSSEIKGNPVREQRVHFKAKTNMFTARINNRLDSLPYLTVKSIHRVRFFIGLLLLLLVTFVLFFNLLRPEAEYNYLTYLPDRWERCTCYNKGLLTAFLKWLTLLQKPKDDSSYSVSFSFFLTQHIVKKRNLL